MSSITKIAIAKTPVCHQGEIMMISPTVREKMFGVIKIHPWPINQEEFYLSVDHGNLHNFSKSENVYIALWRYRSK